MKKKKRYSQLNKDRHFQIVFFVIILVSNTTEICKFLSIHFGLSLSIYLSLSVSLHLSYNKRGSDQIMVVLADTSAALSTD